jgi:hypothetical protein
MPAPATPKTVHVLTPSRASSLDAHARRHDSPGVIALPVALEWLKGNPLAYQYMTPVEALDLAEKLTHAALRELRGAE